MGSLKFLTIPRILPISKSFCNYVLLAFWIGFNIPIFVYFINMPSWYNQWVNPNISISHRLGNLTDIFMMLNNMTTIGCTFYIGYTDIGPVIFINS